MKTIRVLVLDDDKTVRESLTAYLEDMGYEAWAMVDAESALAHLARVPADAAIVDIRLPGMNGEEFIRAAHEHWPQMVFLVYTGSPTFQSPTDIRGFKRVSKQIFVKPLSDMNLLHLEIQQMVKKR
ncbi:MAG: hypothetical protein B6I38_11155 [Anaerolineaceae bacterium 4572_5.1]|nr:MAG: hypothetical protein B6I38_11155 [Anaerolineaceae bacterium 4572_5.1]RLD09485.1 MAG: response regulator [Chloroflexota bacterium]